MPVHNDRAQVVGQIIRDKDGWWLTKHVNPKRHQLRRPPAWATDQDHIDQLLEMDGVGIRLFSSTGEVWEVGIEVFLDNAIALDRGHGIQLALTLKFWELGGQDGAVVVEKGPTKVEPSRQAEMELVTVP